jgi:hypothetical protein
MRSDDPGGIPRDMLPLRGWRVVLLIMTAVSLVGMGMGCRKGPSVSGGRDVTDILITERLSNANVLIRPGDEVRWINGRTTPVRVVFLSSVAGRLSCNQGFSGFMEPVESAVLAPNEHAAACFTHPGSMRYAVLMKGEQPSTDHSVIGLVRVREEPDGPVSAMGP